jgi:hypothetical protein
MSSPAFVGPLNTVVNDDLEEFPRIIDRGRESQYGTIQV